MPHSQDTRHMRYETLYIMLLIFASGLFLAGALLDTPDNIARGLIRIVMTEDPLITDYVRLAGVGAALINSSVVTALSVLILRSSGEPANGFTLVVVGLMAGFSLFGKNPVNTWPIVLGTWLYAKSRKEPFGKYAAVALLSSALGPVISYIILDNGWGTPVLGVATGLMIGFVMPSLSAYTYKIQNGMNLYNVGFACGLMAMLLVSLMSSFGAEPEVSYLWATGYNALFGGLLGTMCIAAILAGLFFCRKPVWAAWAGYRRLLQTSGRAPSDYLRMVGAAPVLINMGVNGLIAMGVILLTGGDLNGPTVGGVLTIVGFSAFGKHAGNIVPIMAGVVLGSFVMHSSVSSGAVQLAMLFGTTLAPISGYFGWPYGVLAGFLHSAVVLYAGTPVAGLNLYNNGFSGGLLAIILYPTIVAIARHRKPVITEAEYFDHMEHDEPETPPPVQDMIEEED